MTVCAKENAPRICINIPGQFGDLFQVAFLGALLKKHFPGCYVGWIIQKAPYASCLKYAPGIDEVLVADRTIPIEQQVAKNPKTFASYDYVFTPDCSSHYRAKFGKKAFRNAIHIGANPRYMKRKSAGYLLRHYYDRLYKYDPAHDDFRSQLIYALNQTLGCNITLDELAHKQPTFLLPEIFYKEMRSYLISDRPNVVIVPRTNVPFKDFPERGFIHLIRNTKNLYHHVVTYGAKGEEEAAHRIAEATGATILRQRHSIHHLTALMTMADIVVGADTGPTHLAWAQNTKVIALFPAPLGAIACNRIGTCDAYMLPVFYHFSHIIDFLPSLVQSWGGGHVNPEKS